MHYCCRTIMFNNGPQPISVGNIAQRKWTHLTAARCPRDKLSQVTRKIAACS
jgi:hypothetical protein